MSDDDLDQGPTHEGPSGGPTYTGDQAAKGAGRELAESRRAHANPHVDAYMRGDYSDEIKIGDEAAKRAEGKNPNIKGPAANAVAEALSRYRNEARPAAIANELATNFNLTPEGLPIGQQQAPAEDTQTAAPEVERRVRAEVERVQAEARTVVNGIAQAMAAQYQTAIQNYIADEFSDIRDMNDARLLAQVDPQRYSRWDAAQKQHAVVAQHTQQEQIRAQQEYQHAWDQWSAEQDRAFAQAAPELNDPVQGPQVKQAAHQTLRELGFSDAELAQSWNAGQLRDARVQRLVLDAARFRQAVASGRRPAPRPIPQVQKPGVARNRGADAEYAEQEHMRDLDKTGGIKDAARALIARRAAARR